MIFDLALTSVAAPLDPNSPTAPGDTLLHRHTASNVRGMNVNTALTNVVP